MKLQISTSILRAACETVADKKEPREALRHILLDFRHHATAPRLRVISTDGGMMGCFQQPLAYDDGAQSEDFRMLLPIDAVKLALKGAGKREHVTLESLPDGRYTLHDTVFAALDASIFPDYHRVIPQANSTPADDAISRQFDPDLLARGQQALNYFYGRKCGNYRLTHTGSHASVMHAGSNDACIVVMPLRDSAFAHHNSDEYQGFFDAYHTADDTAVSIAA